MGWVDGWSCLPRRSHAVIVLRDLLVLLCEKQWLKPGQGWGRRTRGRLGNRITQARTTSPPCLSHPWEGAGYLPWLELGWDATPSRVTSGVTGRIPGLEAGFAYRNDPCPNSDHRVLFKNVRMAGGLAQQVLAVKPDNLSLIPGTHALCPPLALLWHPQAHVLDIVLKCFRKNPKEDIGPVPEPSHPWPLHQFVWFINLQILFWFLS